MNSREPRPVARDAAVEADLREALVRARGVVILTGAGVSAESGVPTFRDAGGLWKERRVEDVATPEAFHDDPQMVWDWYDSRRRAIHACRPNPAHEALARLLLQRDDVTLVTQNVDGLHDRAIVEAGGALPHPRLLHLHGSLFTLRCSRCPWSRPHDEALDTTSVDSLLRCPDCASLARPGVVWFGEMLPPEPLNAAFEAARTADLCLVVGTSALVHPAASVPAVVLESGGAVAEVNPSPTPITGMARWVCRGAAGEILPDVIG